MTHTVALLVYPGFELLDATGPIAVFDAANHVLGQAGSKPFYALNVLSVSGGPIGSSSGVALHSIALEAAPARIGTLLIAGAEAGNVRAAMDEPRLSRWILDCARSTERVGSVCSGAFLLAALGLLDGKRAATHWAACARLARLYPSVQVDSEALYVNDGKLWTSAGVTAGIDMALAMACEDVGPAIVSQAAKRLVLYARRPGYQSQFSSLLTAQSRGDSPFAELIDWAHENLSAALDVPSLAARAGLSERSFYRKFVDATGVTPARFVETLRLDAARLLLSQGLSLKAIALQVGLSPARLSKAFERRFGVSPILFRELHHAAPA
ncbi:GlxA family transcriptional regulator [Sphingosinicella sp. CPCC 101087]|uniref:GlxA family transcriptional regulator n=1 Tax=Sphingosinicella sp. CPCC 101087 TaxID=2497754 RepID=UPI00101BF14F|nr:helix-turn-helix domain-containing protein [Sphingosinicella sp. CPCC 101087]